MPNPKPKKPRIVDLESLCRVYTEANIRRLGGYATGKDVPEDLVMQAITILLAYGHGKPKSTKEHVGDERRPIIVEIVYRKRDDDDEYDGK